MKRLLTKVSVLVCFLILGTFSVQAQTYLSSDVALEKLELELEDIYQDATAPTATNSAHTDWEIGKTFINEVAKHITENQSVPNALQSAFDRTVVAHADEQIRVELMRQRLDALLQE